MFIHQKRMLLHMLSIHCTINSILVLKSSYTFRNYFLLLMYVHFWFLSRLSVGSTIVLIPMGWKYFVISILKDETVTFLFVLGDWMWKTLIDLHPVWCRSCTLMYDNKSKLEIKLKDFNKLVVFTVWDEVVCVWLSARWQAYPLCSLVNNTIYSYVGMSLGSLTPRPLTNPQRQDVTSAGAGRPSGQVTAEERQSQTSKWLLMLLKMVGFVLVFPLQQQKHPFYCQWIPVLLSYLLTEG